MNYTSQKFPAAPAREHEPQREIERRKKLQPRDVLVRAATTELLRQPTGPSTLKPTSLLQHEMLADVRFGSLGNMAPVFAMSALPPKADISRIALRCPLCATSDQTHRSK